MSNLPATQNSTTLLDSIFPSHGFQKEVMVDELYRLRKQHADDYTKELAEKEVFNYLEGDPVKQTAAQRLAQERASPLVSRETQIATLKGMVRDYELGKRKAGLSAHSVLKAVELLNKMTGYEAPVVVEHNHEIKVNVLPIVAQPFTGEMEPLDIIDIGDANVIATTPTTPTNPDPTPPPDQPQTEANPEQTPPDPTLQTEESSDLCPDW